MGRHGERSGGFNVKSFVALMFSSAAFGAAIAIAYWLVAHQETTGTVLLGIMCGAFVFAAGFAIIAERNADVSGDGENLSPADRAGEDLGVFTGASAWPILIAIATALTLIGLLYSPLLAVLAAVGLVLCLLRLGMESNRL